MIAVFTGTRQGTPRGVTAVHLKLEDLRRSFGAELSVFVGDCPTGIDRYVRSVCADLGIDYATFNANWAYSKKRAGPKRNTFMVHVAANLRIAGGQVEVFYYAPPGVKCSGTRNCVVSAKFSKLTCYPLGDSVELP